MAGLLQKHNENKQIGCMSGFLQIFDRQQMVAGKRVHSSKRLPPPPTGVGETVSFESHTDSCQSSPSKNMNGGQISKPAKSPVHLAQKFARHSLDSKVAMDSNGGIHHKDIRKEGSGSSSECISSNTSVVTDGDDKQKLRAPSVIARLMGLESLSSPDQNNLLLPPPEAGLQRSASDSRISSKDPVRSKYIDDNNFQLKTPSNHLQKQSIQNIVASDMSTSLRYKDDSADKAESCKTSPWRSPRSFYDTTDFFPERNQMNTTMQVDFEKKLKMMKGTIIDEHSNDLGTLKQILEVLQFKGLLHKRDTQHNVIYDESNIVLMKPWRVPSSKVVDTKRYGNESRGANTRSRSKSSSPTRVQSNLKRCNSIVKQKPLSIEIQRRNPLHNSPTSSPKRTIKSPRNHHSPKQTLTKNIVTNEKPNIITQNIVTPPSATLKSPKWDGCIEGKSLLQRCDKLLQNIAEMNKNSATTTESPPSSAPVLPSPVSVLDSGFDKDELASPLHNIEFKAKYDEFDESSSVSTSPTKLTKREELITEREEFTSDDPDFIYISKILRASQDLNEEDYSSIFFLVEKQLYNTSDTSNVSKQHRKLVFDIIVEILDRNSMLPPWKGSMSSIKHIWSEFQRIREIKIKASDVLVDLINGVLRRDLIEISEWGDHPIEMSEAILDVERMIFKDLVCDAIRDFDESSNKCRFLKSQRKLVFQKCIK